MNNLNNTLLFFVCVLAGTACSRRLILSNHRETIIYRQGDRVQLLEKGEPDTLPSCTAANNVADSIQGFFYYTIDSIAADHMDLTYVSGYRLDTLDYEERKALCLSDRKRWFREWQHYETYLFDPVTKEERFAYAWPVYALLRTVYYDSIAQFLELSSVRECESPIRAEMILIAEGFGFKVEQHLARIYAPRYRMRVKG